MIKTVTKEVMLWENPKGEREETTKILNNLVSIKRKNEKGFVSLFMET